MLLPGDIERVGKIAKYLSDNRRIGQHYSFLIQKGKYGEVPITICSTGIGGPSVSIALEELVKLGGKYFIRVGISGPLQEKIKQGDLVISTAAVRLDGASRDFVRIEYPAVADYEVLLALIKAAQKLGYRYHVGIIASAASFTCGQGHKSAKGYLPLEKEKLIQELKEANVYNIETESATLFTLSNIFGVKASTVTAAVNLGREKKFIKIGEKRAIETS